MFGLFGKSKKKKQLDIAIHNKEVGIKGQLPYPTNICPSCNEILQKTPIRSITCKKCKEKLRVIINPITNRTYISNEKRYKNIDILKVGIQNLQGKLEDIELMTIYTQYVGRESDMVWSIYNRLLTTSSSHEKVMIYTTMAQILEMEGKDNTHIVKQKYIQELTDCKERIYHHSNKRILSKYVGIMGNGDCNYSKRFDKKRYYIDDEVKNPKLPPKDCNRYSGCVCSYHIIPQGYEDGYT